jgi:hypothetical protein
MAVEPYIPCLVSSSPSRASSLTHCLPSLPRRCAQVSEFYGESEAGLLGVWAAAKAAAPAVIFLDEVVNLHTCWCPGLLAV